MRTGRPRGSKDKAPRRKQSEEMLTHLYEIRKTPEYREMMSGACKGREVSEETRQKLRAAWVLRHQGIAKE